MRIVLVCLLGLCSSMAVLRRAAPSTRSLRMKSSDNTIGSTVSPNIEHATIRQFKGDPTASLVRNDKKNKALISLSVQANNQDIMTVDLLQNTNGPVPRSFLPSIMIINDYNSNKNNELYLYTLIEESLKWYLDNGGRVGRLEIAVPFTLSKYMEYLQLKPVIMQDSVPEDVTDLRTQYMTKKSNYVLYACNSQAVKNYITDRINNDQVTNDGTSKDKDLHTLWNIMGRLQHDLGDVKGAIKSYTTALQAYPRSAPSFRNLGSAYHSTGDLQLAFASYQQAVQLDPTDAVVYLKLAYFYEDFATKDWVDAADHAQSCYQYYLDQVDPDDTSVLTRLGNLLVREHKNEEAVKVYNKALSIDEKLHNVWFNRAHAQVKLCDSEGACESLRKTLELDPTITAARHMLLALNDEEATKVKTSDDKYIKELFDSYAQTYDNHGKKLLYSAPRVIRQELAKIYRTQMGDVVDLDRPLEAIPVSSCSDHDHANTPGAPVTSFKEASEPVGSGCSTYRSFVNASLDILDIGCGTGLAGAWLKDYAKTLIGVDLSEQMINVARKKMLYQELYVDNMHNYLANCQKTFDIIVAADVLSYIGDLNSTFKQVASKLRSGACFAFTIEAIAAGSNGAEQGYRLLRSGRFGYNKEYIDSLIAELGESFTVPLSRDFSPRLDAGDPVPGYLYIIQKK